MNRLFKSVLLVGAVSLSLVGSSSASLVDWINSHKAKQNEFYAGVLLGNLGSGNIGHEQSFGMNNDTIGFGALVGYKRPISDLNWAALELSYLKADNISGSNYNTSIQTFDINSKFGLFPNKKIQPYVLVGLMIPKVSEINEIDNAIETSKQTGLGYNAGIGTSLYITDTVSFDLAGLYRDFAFHWPDGMSHFKGFYFTSSIRFSFGE